MEQFRKKYGVVKNVSDRPYVSNSFHCHVTEDITPIQKQDLEGRFWNLCNGGKIQYVRYPISYNRNAVKTLVCRAMELGYYEECMFILHGKTTRNGKSTMLDAIQHLLGDYSTVTPVELICRGDRAKTQKQQVRYWQS